MTRSNDSVGEAVKNTQINADVLIVYGNVLVYGGSLTRRHQGIISFEDGTQQLISSSGIELPVIFCTSKRCSEVSRLVVYWETGEDISEAIKPREKRLRHGAMVCP